MAWANVDAQLITMGESVTPLQTEGGLPSRFRYVREASEEAPPRMRDFMFQVDSGSRSGPNIQQRRSFADVSLLIFYEEMRDFGQQNRAMVEDWEAFRDVFTDTDNWNRPTSTIESLALDGGEEIFEYAIERLEGGAVLAIRFPLLYTG
jgi:hypothetical protein